MSGKLFAIGLGPGDPELITVKGQRLLGDCSVVFVPLQEGRESMAQKLAERWTDPAKLKLLPFKMARKPEQNVEHWRKNAGTILEAMNSGAQIAFVTEGDPLLYSTFIHVYGELVKLAPDADVEVVPGISSVQAGAAILKKPLGDDVSRVAIVPATGDVLHALATFDSVVVLKVSADLEKVLKALKVTGRTHQAIYVERAGWPEQRIVTEVESLRKHKPSYFGLLVVAR
jgi:precorrin-2/cobalt-factor-2 C20-methyltransferase